MSRVVKATRLIFCFRRQYGKSTKKISSAMGKERFNASIKEDLLNIAREMLRNDEKSAVEYLKLLSSDCEKNIPGMVRADLEQAQKSMAVHRSALIAAGAYDFESYLMAVEFDREPQKKFYIPRRGYLRRYVQAYQSLLDGEIDFLSVSMPKRSGKSQLGINFTNMISGKFPDKSTLMEGTGDDLVKSFYEGCLEYLDAKGEYCFNEIFPEAKLVQTNADTKIINLQSRSRFPTIMCRSVPSPKGKAFLRLLGMGDHRLSFSRLWQENRMTCRCSASSLRMFRAAARRLSSKRARASSNTRGA